MFVVPSSYNNPCCPSRVIERWGLSAWRRPAGELFSQYRGSVRGVNVRSAARYLRNAEPPIPWPAGVALAWCSPSWPAPHGLSTRIPGGFSKNGAREGGGAKPAARRKELRSWSPPLACPKSRCHRGPQLTGKNRIGFLRHTRAVNAVVATADAPGDSARPCPPGKSKANLRLGARGTRFGFRRKGQPVIAGYPLAPTPIPKFNHPCEMLDGRFATGAGCRGWDGPAGLRPPAGRPNRPRPSWPAQARAPAQPRIRRSRSFSASPGRPRPEHGSS